MGKLRGCAVWMLAGPLASVALGNEPVGGWKGKLLARADGIDRMVIEPIQPSMADHFKTPPFEIRGADRIGGFFKLVEIDDASSGGFCMCRGQWRFTFFRGDRRALTLSDQHGQALRWEGGRWPGDAQLTGASREALPQWFKDQGFPVLKEERDVAVAQEKKRAEANAAFANAFPEKVRPILLGTIRPLSDIFRVKEAADEIVRGVGDGEEVVACACKAFGAIGGPSGPAGIPGQYVEAAVGKSSGPQIVAAFERLKDDRQAMLGAIRLMFNTRDFASKLPEDRRAEWTVRLADLVLKDAPDAREHKSEKAIVLRQLGGVDLPASKALLHDALRGKFGKDFGPSSPRDRSLSLRAEAALALGQLNEDSVKGEIEALLASAKTRQDQLAFSVSLALLGDPTRLDAEAMDLKYFTIARAEVRAIERFHGDFGVPILLEQGLDTANQTICEDIVAALKEIAGPDRPEGLDAKIPRGDVDKAAVRAWWKANGPAILERRRQPGPRP